MKREISKLDKARMIYENYKNSLKYNSKNKKNIDEYKKLKTFKRDLNNIINISIIKQANINNNQEFNNNYLIIEDYYGPNVVLDLDNGIDESYRFRTLNLTNKSKIINLYKDKGRCGLLEITQIKEVNYYSKGLFINNYSNQVVFKDYILEIIDNLNNIIYIDCLCKNLYYNRNNYSIKNPNRKQILFKNGEQRKTPTNIFDNRYKLINLLTYISEEEEL